MATSSKEEKKDTAGKKESKVTEASLNMDELRELADLVNENGFTDFEFQNEKIRVRLSKAVTVAAAPVPAVAQVAPLSSTEATEISAPATTEKTDSPEADEDDGLHKITSPIVGTFYSSPAPDKPVFAKVGDKVSADTVVCIVEAMKLMNEIQAEASGEIVKVYVENAQPVEYGQPLFGIKQ